MQADFAVIGRGLMGTACAAHLAQAGADVVLIGPDAPSDPQRHDGPFGSFHDAGRITRSIAEDPVWARLSLRSIARYGALQDRSGIRFHTACGAMIAGPTEGPMSGMMSGVARTAAALGIVHRRLNGPELAAAHPSFRLPTGDSAVHDPFGGVIDPRAMRRAHETVAMAAGARMRSHHVVERQGGRLRLSDGTIVQARHVVLAMGGWSPYPDPGEARLAMQVYQRTVLLVAVDDRQAALHAGMPSLIYLPEDRHTDLYVLPPIRYPDGRHYIKIGGEAASPVATGGAALNAWFKTKGSAAAAAGLRGHLQALMPDLPIAQTNSAACAVSFTATGHPYIGRLDAQTTILTGGNGAAAKCADELGRLGAVAALGGDVAAEGIGADLAPRYI